MIYINTHSKQRALERYGLYFNDEDIKGIWRSIREGEAEFVSFTFRSLKGDRKVSIWKLKWEGVWIYPLCAFEKGVIVTFYTKGMLKDYYRRMNKKGGS